MLQFKFWWARDPGTLMCSSVITKPSSSSAAAMFLSPLSIHVFAIGPVHMNTLSANITRPLFVVCW
jgi:hypothetical protein